MECLSIFWHNHLKRYDGGHAKARAWLTQYILDENDDKHLACVIAGALHLTNPQWIFSNLGLFIGPLLAWGSQQSWHAQIDWRRASSKWCNMHTPRQCTIAFERMRPWLKHTNVRYQTPLLAHIWEDTCTKIDWSAASLQEWQMGLDLGAEIKQLDNSKPFFDIWAKALISSMLRGSPLTAVAQTDRILALLKRDLPAELKLSMLALCQPSVWACPLVAQNLMALLPKDEFDRFILLPWATSVEYELNQSMVHLYCPIAYQVLNWVTRPYDWQNRIRIECLLRNQQPIKCLSLPMETLRLCII